MPPIDIDKILSDPLLIVAAVLLVVSPILFLVALVKFMRTPSKTPFAIPGHDLSPVATPKEVREPAEELGLSPVTSLEPGPVPPTQPQPPLPPPTAAAPTRRTDSASEKTVVMPAGMAEMHSEVEIAFSQLKLLNKRVASLEQELARLKRSPAPEGGGPTPPQPL